MRRDDILARLAFLLMVALLIPVAVALVALDGVAAVLRAVRRCLAR